MPATGGRRTEDGYVGQGREGEVRSAVLSGLIGGVVAFRLVSLAERTQKPATVAAGGWKVLRTGWLLRSKQPG